MSGWRTVAGGEFAIKWAPQGVCVRCLVCLVVSPNGGAIRHPKAFLPETSDAADWIRDHAHGDRRSLKEAKALARARAENARALRGAMRAYI